MIQTPRPSFEALPSWLSRLPDVAATPIRAWRPPEQNILQRALANPRLPLHILVLAVGLGIVAAMAAGSVRERNAESRAEMSAFATRKAAELHAFGLLRSRSVKGSEVAIPVGGSLTENLPGYSDVVEGTDGRRFRRRWTVSADLSGERRVIVRVIPTTQMAGRDSFELATVLPRRR
jgi:hypothetical protein